MTSITIVSTASSWYNPHAHHLVQLLDHPNRKARLVNDHREIEPHQDIVFYLSYFRIVPDEVLRKSQHNIVVHESDLPQGRGWAPMFWQVIEGKNQIPAVAFEAVEEMDAGPIYARTITELDGTELHDEIRHKQAEATERLVLECVDRYENGTLIAVPQTGVPTYYEKRNPENSRLDPDGTLRSQFNLLRTVNNQEFPAYFELRGQRYILKIEKDTREEP